MNPVTPVANFGWTTIGSGEAAVSDCTQRVLRACQPPMPRVERRRDKRVPFPQLLTLYPIANDELRPIGEPVSVVGKNLSHHGLDFFHCEPLPYRRVIVSLDPLPWESQLVLSISWCRFLRLGWYDSGGRFTQVVKPAAEFGRGS